MEISEKIPEKRSEILYSRISLKNKKFISATAKKKDISESVLVEYILDCFRETNVSNQRKSRKSN